MKKALIAMSGGVDSSLAAKLMLEKGYACIGCTMKLFENEDAGITKTKTCCSLDDVEDARGVAYRLGIPFYVFNFTDKFREKVIRNFAESYERGFTPNPCIECNAYLKFEALYQRAMLLGCDCIVTGHYARIAQEEGRFVLKKAVDETKDQSYVLYRLTQEQLAHTVFPLGDRRKSEVRAMAERSGFGNAHKPDSQDICFAPDGDYAGAVERFTGKRALPGDFTDKNGNVLGQHRGVIHYTIGQRRGLGVCAPEPYYVCDICPETNTVVLGRNEDLFRSDAEVHSFHWISGKAPKAPIRCKAKIRYRQPEQWVTAVPAENGVVQLRFDEPQRAITPGQAAVLYEEDTVLGGGVIARR